MRNLATGLTFITLLCFVGSATLAQQAEPAVYGALPDVQEVQISPDGKSLAALQNINGAKALVFYDLDNSQNAPVGIGLGDIDGRDIEWADNDRVLVLISKSERVTTTRGLVAIEFFRWVSVSQSTQKAELLLGNEPGYYLPNPGQLLSVLPDEPDTVLFARWSSRAGFDTRNTANSRINRDEDSGFGYALFKVNLKNGRKRLVDGGTVHTVDWLVNEAGEPVARIDYNASTQRKTIYLSQGGSRYAETASWTEERGDSQGLNFYSLSSEPNIAIGTAYIDGIRSLVKINLTTGEIADVIFNNGRYDLYAAEYDVRQAKTVSLRYFDNLPRTRHLDPQDEKLQDNLRNALPNAEPMIVSRSANGNRMIIEAIYTDHPTQFFLFDKTARTLNMIATSYRKLDGKVVAKNERYDYPGDDGLLIEGYLTVPAGAAKTNMPLIVLPHGGPEWRSDQSFDWWAFFYAANGYLVYQPNFRGSYGYGWNFRSAGYGEWGRKMQDDITQGVQKLIAAGVADPDRICIVGASYGGYAALAGATLTPNLYACAVSVNGVSNLPDMLGEEARSSELAEDYWETRIGSRFRDVDELNAVSPAKIAAQTGPPIQLIVSKDDIVVPPGQSIQMRDALKAAGKSYDYVELDGEDHWLSTGAMRTEMLRRSIDFIDEHIGSPR